MKKNSYIYSTTQAGTINRRKAYRLFFRAFSNQTRMDILQLLKKGSRSVGEICTALNIEQSLVSHHLRCLKNCGFVDAKREGKKVIYSIDEKHIKPILDMIEEHITKYIERIKSCRVLKNV